MLHKSDVDFSGGGFSSCFNCVIHKNIFIFFDFFKGIINAVFYQHPLVAFVLAEQVVKDYCFVLGKGIASLD